MEWRRVLPATLVSLLLIFIVLLLTERGGGISREGVAVLLVLTLGISIAVIITRQNGEIGSKVGPQSSTIDRQTEQQVDESSLPDPLDEGFDTPLL